VYLHLNILSNMLTLHFFRVFLILLMCGVNLTSIAATPVLVRLYQPENFDAKGQQIPITPQITKIFNYFEKQAGIKFDIVVLPWKRAQLETMHGNGILYGFSKSTERLEKYRFSQPVVTFHVWAISYGKNNSQFTELKDLKGKTVTSGLGLSHGEEYEKAKNDVFIVQEEFISYRERFRKLVKKQSDVVFIPFHQNDNRDQVEKFVNQKIIPEFKDPELDGRTFEISINPLFNDTIHFASAKGHFDEIINKIDKAVNKGMKDGALPKLYQEK
jgi:ABC-type amino acid transport substrate-binding protein